MLLPLVMDIHTTAIALVGNGDATLRRLGLLREGGARHISLYAPSPEARLAAEAGQDIVPRLPTPDELSRIQLLFIGDLAVSDARPLVEQARRFGALVNVEDVRELCDFHLPAMVRRGDLLVTASTNGRAPGLARWIKRDLEQLLDAGWADRLTALAGERARWRAAGMDKATLARRTDELIEERGWSL